MKYLSQVSSSSENSQLIAGWYRECKNSERTLGYCCNVSAVTFYLSYGRYQPIQKIPADYLNSIFIKSIELDDDESDGDTIPKQRKLEKVSER